MVVSRRGKQTVRSDCQMTTAACFSLSEPAAALAEEGKNNARVTLSNTQIVEPELRDTQLHSFYRCPTQLQPYMLCPRRAGESFM
jgi:hypothetical protein